MNNLLKVLNTFLKPECQKTSRFRYVLYTFGIVVVFSSSSLSYATSTRTDSFNHCDYTSNPHFPTCEPKQRSGLDYEGYASSNDSPNNISNDSLNIEDVFPFLAQVPSASQIEEATQKISSAAKLKLRKAKLEMCKAYFKTGINGFRMQTRLTNIGLSASQLESMASFGLTAAIYYSVRAGFHNDALSPILLGLRLYNYKVLGLVSVLGGSLLGMDLRYYVGFFIRMIDRVASQAAGASVSDVIDDQTKVRTIADHLVMEAQRDCEKEYDPTGELRGSTVVINYDSLSCRKASEVISMILSDDSVKWEARVDARRGLSDFMKRKDCSENEKQDLQRKVDAHLWIYEKNPEATYDALSMSSRVLGAALVGMLTVTSGPLVAVAALTGGAAIAGASYATGYWAGEGYLGAAGLAVGTAYGALEAKLFLSTLAFKRRMAAQAAEVAVRAATPTAAAAGLESAAAQGIGSSASMLGEGPATLRRFAATAMLE